MSLEALLKEIEAQKSWPESLQKSFIKDCLKAQGGSRFQKAKTKDVENIFSAYKNQDLHDESIQYYVRVYLEMVYGIE